jgi:hypothetical protein
MVYDLQKIKLKRYNKGCGNVKKKKKLKRQKGKMCRQVKGEKKTVEENEGEGGVRLRLKGEGWFF